jgi:predicted DNA-binding antitoxin AbrB/MazE fold protein
MRVKAIYRNEVLKLLEELNLNEGEKVEIEISNAVQWSKINPKLGKEIAESDELAVLDA